MKIRPTPGTTPLEQDELEQLIPQFLTTMSQLNAYEAENILEAQDWLSHRKQKVANILLIEFLLQLHKKMFSKTWIWAGQFRKTNKNIGCDKAYIAEELKKLLGDTEYWIHNRTYSPQEVAARFHHRLVKIHPFPNGNGRHARLTTDALLQALDNQRFSWGSELRSKNEIKDKYISALQAADKNDYSPLFEFLGLGHS